MDKFTQLSNEKLCIRCAGRIFATVGHTMTNLDRGNQILFTSRCFGYELNFVEEKSCSLCSGIFLEIPKYAGEIQKRLSDYEYRTILIGSSFPASILEKERILQEKYGNLGEPIKKEFSRELGKYYMDMTGKEFDRSDPDIMAKVNTEYMSIEFQIKSLLIYGIYRKNIRGIPQTRWIKYSEKTDTVESIIGDQIKIMGNGKDYALHGAGREDVDVRMLGNGREFVIELTEPRIRNINLEKLTENINKTNLGVTVSSMRPSSREEIKNIKDEKHYKIYRAKLESEKPVSCEELKEICKEFNGKVIYQRTPLRVSSSRSDIVRERKISEMSVECGENGDHVLTIEAEAGTYIKELVSGDGGRTKPSLAEKLGTEIRIRELDVIMIKR